MSLCYHTLTKMWEPHLAGARKCLDCKKVYNPNREPNWQIENEGKEMSETYKQGDMVRLPSGKKAIFLRNLDNENKELCVESHPGGTWSVFEYGDTKLTPWREPLTAEFECTQWIRCDCGMVYPQALAKAADSLDLKDFIGKRTKFTIEEIL